MDSLRFFIISVLSFTVCASLSSNVALPYTLPSLSYSSLVSQRAASEAITALTTIGALQITDIPNYASSRLKALKAVGTCHLKLHTQTTSQSVASSVLSDGTFRLSTGAATSSDGTRGEMSSECGDESQELRNVVDDTTALLMKAIDANIGTSSYQSTEPSTLLLQPYKTLHEIFEKGSHLEHIHSYHSGNSNSGNRGEGAKRDVMTLPFHKDMGLFIAMTAGLYDVTPNAENKYNDKGAEDLTPGLYIKLPSGLPARAIFNDDSLVIMMGKGAEDWLHIDSSLSFKAVEHALVAGVGEGGVSNSRAWYGKMFLPPLDALLPSSSVHPSVLASLSLTPSSSSSLLDSSTISYELFRSASQKFLGGKNNNEDKQVLPAACESQSPSPSTSLQKKASPASTLLSRYLDDRQLMGASFCTASGGQLGIYCWTYCVAIPSDLPCPTSEVQCVDTVTGLPTNGNAMCPHHSPSNECFPQCSSNFSLPSAGYCAGSGTTMNMAGFDSLAADEPGSSPCVNFLFDNWTLNSNIKLVAACFGTVLLGVTIQLLTKLRMFLSPQFALVESPPAYSLASLGNVLASFKPVTKAFLTILFYGTQTLLSYLIMLIAMTYNVELFACVAAGLTLGYAFFLLDLPQAPHSTDPCCSALDDGTGNNPIKKTTVAAGGGDGKHGLYSRLITNSIHEPSKPQANVESTEGSCCGGGFEADEVSVNIN